MAKSAKAKRSTKASVQNKSAKGKPGGKLGKIVLNPDEYDKNAFYCVKCRALCFSRKPDVKVGKTKNGRNRMSGKCANKVKAGSVPKGPKGSCGTKVGRFFS
jgi:hypothetical protein